jgi:hypothetical protein
MVILEKDGTLVRCAAPTGDIQPQRTPTLLGVRSDRLVERRRGSFDRRIPEDELLQDTDTRLSSVVAPTSDDH